MPISYARVVKDVVVEVISLADGHTLTENFHPDLCAQCIEIPEGETVAVRYTHDDAGFHEPAPVEPVKQTRFSPLEFQARLHADELGSIAQAALGSPPIFIFMLQMASAQYIDITDERTIAGVHALRDAKLLTNARATEILTA